MGLTDRLILIRGKSGVLYKSIYNNHYRVEKKNKQKNRNETRNNISRCFTNVFNLKYVVDNDGKAKIRSAVYWQMINGIFVSTLKIVDAVYILYSRIGTSASFGQSCCQ